MVPTSVTSRFSTRLTAPLGRTMVATPSRPTMARAPGTSSRVGSAVGLKPSAAEASMTQTRPAWASAKAVVVAAWLKVTLLPWSLPWSRVKAAVSTLLERALRASSTKTVSPAWETSKVFELARTAPSRVREG